MAAVGNELFVIDGGSNTIDVFSLAGAHLRSFGLGDGNRPHTLRHFDGRLYLEDYGEKGSRIIVLTLEGERLQVWRPDAGRAVSALKCIYGRKLLIHTTNANGGDARLEALHGI